MHWRDETEKTSIGTVSETMATYLDQISGPDVLPLDAVPLKCGGICRFDGPLYGLTAFLFDFEIDPRVGIHPVHFLNRTLHGNPLRHVVIAVRMMRDCRRRKSQGAKY